MKTNKLAIHVFLMVLGAIIIAASGLLLNKLPDCVIGTGFGIGAGLCGMSIANLIIQLYYKRHPAIKKQSDIEARDERTLAINHKAKAKAFDYTINLLMVYPFLMILADLPLWLIFTTIGIYLFGAGAQFFFIIRYNKEM